MTIVGITASATIGTVWWEGGHDADPAVQKYVIEESPVYANQWKPIAEVGPGASVANFPVVTCTARELRVVAVNVDGETPSAQSGIVVEGRSRKPSDLTVSDRTLTGFQVRWTEGPETCRGYTPPVSGYRVERFADGWEEVAELPPEARSYSLSGLAPAQSERLRVSSFARNGESETSEIVGRTSGPPTAPPVTQVERGASSASVHWSPAVPDEGAPVIGYRVEREITDGWATVAELAADASAHTFEGLRSASSYRVRVIALSAAGEGLPGEVWVTTTGTRTTRLTVTTSSGKPVTGGAVTWATDDGDLRSSSAYGLTSNGVVDLLRTPAAPGVIRLTNARLPTGETVNGLWRVQLGASSAVDATVPAVPASSARQVRVKLPNGLGVADADVVVSGLQRSVHVDGFTFEAADFAASGVTDEEGDFRASGYALDVPTAVVSYDDGVLFQRIRGLRLDGNVTVATLEEMPWLEVGAEAMTADRLDLVPVRVRLGATRSLVGHPRAGSAPTVRIIPPAGASQRGCSNTKLTGRTDARGRLTLKVCASKSGLYRIQGRGAVATSAVFLKVRRAPPMPVTSASSTSPRPGQARVAWNPPKFTGGAPILRYVVTVAGRRIVTKKTALVVKNLRNAYTYDATVVAVTKFGTSQRISVSVSVA